MLGKNKKNINKAPAQKTATKSYTYELEEQRAVNRATKNKKSALSKPVANSKKMTKKNSRQTKNINTQAKPKKVKKTGRSIVATVKELISKSMHLMFVGLFLAMFFLTAYRYTNISKLKYEINSKKGQIRSIDNDIKVETVKLYDLTTTQKVEEKAKELGLQKRTQEQTIYIEVE